MDPYRTQLKMEDERAACWEVKGHYTRIEETGKLQALGIKTSHGKAKSPKVKESPHPWRAD